MNLKAGDLRRPVRRIVVDDAGLDPSVYPGTIAAVAQLMRDKNLELGPITVLVGENGSGKSTLVEAIAQAFGLSPEGGSTGARHSTRPTESALNQSLRLERGIGASRWGFFLRAETMHGFYTYLEENPSLAVERFHEVSHGESFLELLTSRFQDPGFYVLDEPESALSFSGCLTLMGVILDLVRDGRSQVLLATHSPVVAALPGATILQLDDTGYHRATWEELSLVDHHRRFLTNPQAYLRHLQA